MIGASIQILDDPFVLSAVLATLLPLAVAGILAGILGGAIGVWAAGAAIAIAFIVAHVAILGWPVFPPRSSLQKIVYVAVAGLIVGAILDTLTNRAAIRSFAIVWPGVLVAWLGWQQLLAADPTDLGKLVTIWIAGAFVFDGLNTLRNVAIVAPTMVMVAGIGASLVAFIGAAASLSQLAAALAAATGGFLLWNWPKGRFKFSLISLFGAGSVLFSIVVAMALFSQANKLALAVLILTIAAGFIRERLPFVESPVLGPIVFGVVSALPVILAIAIGYFMTASAEV
jgi:hypothetical protein